MKVLWVHNFNPENKNSGVFMYEFHKYFDNKYDSVKVKLYYFNVRNPINILSQIKEIRRYSRYYDVIHVQYGSVLSLLVGMSLAGCKAKKIVSIRGSDWYYLKYTNLYYRIHSYMATNATKIAIKMYDCVISVSKSLEKEVKVYSNTSRVLTNPVNLEKFYIKDKMEARAKYDRNKNVSYILFASISLDSEIKRFYLLEAAINKVNKRGLAVKIVTTVDVDHDDMCDLYNSVDLLCLPSTHEGWPNVVKESLSCGIPFISTKVSDLADIAKRSNSCFIFEDNPDDLAKAIEKALSKPVSSNERRLLRSIIRDTCDIEEAALNIKKIYLDENMKKSSERSRLNE